MSDAFWAKTQSVLQGADQPLVRKPKLTENLLKKPPFRFLHDVITEVIRNTGFAKDLYGEQESNSKNVKDKESKVAFLNKIIEYVSEASGTKVPVRPLKVVAGLEPELTNQFLQQLGKAASRESRGKDDESTEKENKIPAEDQFKPEEQAPPALQKDSSSPPQSRGEEKGRAMPRPDFAPLEKKPEAAKHAASIEDGNNNANANDPEAASLPPRPMQRPMSARKAPPKVKSNIEEEATNRISSMTSGDIGSRSRPTSGAKGILKEGESEDEEEDGETEVIMGADVGPSNFNMLDAQQGGKLVRDIVETAQNIETLDNERSKQQGGEGGDAKPKGMILRRRRSVAAESSAKPVEKVEDMEKVRSAIQKLCQSTNPLVSSVDNLQEDVEQMLREANYWGQEQKIYKQKINEMNQMQNDFSEYKYKIQDLDEEIQIMHTKISNMKAQILNNDKSLTEMLNLAVGGVLMP